MMSVLGTVQLALLALLLFVLAAAAIFGALETTVLNRLARLGPAARVRALFAYVAAPPLLAVSCTVACFTPWLLSSFLPHLDHCAHHGGHPHLCLAHPPASAGATLGWLLLAAACVYLGAKAVRGAAALLRARALLTALTASAVQSRHAAAYELEQPMPFCLSAGLFRPVVIVSTGLVAKLSALELEAVLAHEHAHARRRDALLLATARVLCTFHFPRPARRLMAELELACELSCDEDASAQVGDRMIVADAIVSVARLLQGRTQPAVVGVANFGQHCLDARIKALLDEPRRGVLVPGAFVILCGLMLLSLACADPLHHATETLLAAFSG